VAVATLTVFLAWAPVAAPRREYGPGYDPGLVAAFALENGGQPTILPGRHPGARFDTPHGVLLMGQWAEPLVPGGEPRPVLHLHLQTLTALSVAPLDIAARLGAQRRLPAAATTVRFTLSNESLERRFAAHRTPDAEPREVIALAARLETTLNDPGLEGLVQLRFDEGNLQLVVQASHLALRVRLQAFWRIHTLLVRAGNGTRTTVIERRRS
jgi:hypothetical protein